MHRMPREVCAFAVAVMMFMLMGCKGDTTSDVGGYADAGYADVVLELKPDPPVALKQTLLTAKVYDEEGRALTDAEIVFDLSMPGMYHGENRPEAVEASPGVYEADAIFTMGGKWLVKVEVKAPDIEVRRDFYTTVEGG